jgi:hypothetical protein
VAYRNEYLRLIGLPDDERDEIRICDQHGSDQLSISYKWSDMEGSEYYASLPITVPSSSACRSNLHTDCSNVKSSGTAYQRSQRRQIQEIKDNENSDLILSMIQSFELEDGNTNEIHPSVAEAAGINCHLEVVATNLNYRFDQVKSTITPKRNKVINTVHRISSLSDGKILHKTGFKSMNMMISYNCVICNGCIETIQDRQSPLSWFEEWLYFLKNCTVVAV